jgi:c-di-GMP-binding flagellar brake protein YcgR
MQTNTPKDLRRWHRQPATIPISLVLKAENLKVDNSATVLDFSFCGVGVLTTLALFPGERVRIVSNKGESPNDIRARVVWVREDLPNQLSHAGLEFLDISEAQKMHFMRGTSST